MLHPLRVVAAVGAITRLFSLAFLLPVLIAVVYDPYDVALLGVFVPRNVLVFLLCFAFCYAVSAVLRTLSSRVADEDLQEREAYLTVGLGWLLLCLLAMLPFMLSGVLRSPVDAFFETMSGLTTTGATVMAGDLDAVSHSIMIWRAFLQFIGGMGIIVLGVAILAKLTHGGMQMLQAEVPGPTVGRVAPRLAQTARLMWGVYLSLAGVLFVILCAVFALRHGMGGREVFFEALLHTFTTLSTGGFSNHSLSIAHFDDALLEGILIVFMLIAGTNFTLILLVSYGNWQALVKDPEWRFYMLNFGLVSLLMTGILWRAGGALWNSLRDATFIVASLMTSTGFGTADFDAWPAVAKFLAIFLMVAGGTAGSTAGGMKMARILLLFKVVQRELTRIKHPQAVVPIRIAGRVVKPATVMAAVGFFFAFVTIWVVCTVLLVALDPHFTDVVDAASASISAISNIGPGLGVVGPTQNYASLTAASKLILSAEMWFGRLEIFTALLVFMPGTWRH